MPISTEHVGRSYPATEPYVVSRAKVRELATALGDDSEAFRGAAPIAPPTFAIVVAGHAWEQMFNDPDLGLALERIVHGEQGFEWRRPLRVGDQVTATLTIDKVRTRGPVDWIGSAATISTTDGEEVCRVAATFVHSHPGGEDGR